MTVVDDATMIAEGAESFVKPVISVDIIEFANLKLYSSVSFYIA